MEFKRLLEFMKIEKVYKFYFELYVRYHEKDERRVEQALEALLRQYGKRQKIENHMKSGKKIAYMNRVMDIEYRTYNVSIKTYRHKHYSRYSPEHPEYHPKLELSAYKENAELTSISIETIKTIAILLNTLIKTLRLKALYSEYDLQQETVEVHGVDTEIARILKGVKKRVKAIQILGKEHHDIRIAIAELLVEKKLKPAQIARLLEYKTRSVVYRIINELIESGVIKRVGRGKYEWANRKAQLEKIEVVRHIHVRTLQELVIKVKELKQQYKEVRIETPGNIVINYETEHEKIRLITNVIISKDVELIDPVTRRRIHYNISPHELIILMS
jgi:hypothetical protein